MKRKDLEHLLRACGDIVDDTEILVIGSQSILGQFPNAPEPLRVSIEADFIPLNHPERADLIDGTIGELSPFHETYGYYSQGVSKETATLPRGWQERLIKLESANTRGVTGFCLEVHDLARIVRGFHVAKAPSVRQIGARTVMSDAGIVEHYVEERRASTARSCVGFARAARPIGARPPGGRADGANSRTDGVQLALAAGNS